MLVYLCCWTFDNGVTMRVFTHVRSSRTAILMHFGGVKKRNAHASWWLKAESAQAYWEDLNLRVLTHFGAEG